ncbi:PATATIN-like protein 5 [Actinidia rufa]|uniref:Patatin n=1 Tax=Actinidia rufa TaxID=165716 RepID=A0A7J0F6L2_9ERIC|nr:PATATIN-like protein 5 [Actinidia rufa]
MNLIRIGNNLINTVTSFFGAVTGPKYDGKHLRTLVKDLLGNTTVNQTLTDVVIPTFDIKRLQPVIFSTDAGNEDVSKNALLSDICLGTSAAPTYLPAYYFETKYENGQTRSYDLIDGGVAANNPVNSNSHNPHLQRTLDGKIQVCVDIKPMESRNMLVLSLGTGVPKQEEPKYNAAAASKWGLLNWVFHNGRHTLTGDAASLDIATKENMQRLVQIGNELLKKPMSRVNLETGRFEVVGEVTNEEALIRFAEQLSEERKRRKVQ